MRPNWVERGLRAAIAVVLGVTAGVVAAATTHIAAAGPLGRSATTFPRPVDTATTPPTWAEVPAVTTTTLAKVIQPAVLPRPAPAAPGGDSRTASASGQLLEERGQAALRRLSYPYQQLGYAIQFLPGRSGYYGRGFHEQRRIEIYVRDGETDEELAHVVAHEIGHAVDFLYHTPSRDAEWLRIRGVDPATSWAPCPFCPDFGFPSGDFAESFALWQLGATDFRSTLAPRPTPAQLQQLAPLFAP